MDFGGKKISREVLEKLAKCQSEEEVIALAKENGVEMTAEQAKAFMGEVENFELNEEDLKKVAGGYCNDCFDDEYCECYNPNCVVYYDSGS